MTKATKTATATKKTAAKKTKPAGKMSALDAAAKVLTEKGVAMTCPELIGVMAAKGYWSSPGGKTPAATLSAAILREIAVKGDAARFARTAPGRFAAKGAPECRALMPWCRFLARRRPRPPSPKSRRRTRRPRRSPTARPAPRASPNSSASESTPTIARGASTRWRGLLPP
jgi:HB1, ASXL, restriction endonuclease HTH domain